jgi:hypothetical protein
VAVRTHTDIIVGADSKVHYDVATDNVVGTTCKIFQVGRVFFAFAGFIWSKHFDYDPRAIATGAIQQGGTIVEMMDRYQDSVSPPLLEAATYYHDKHPDLYQRMTADSGEVLDTAFFGVENDTPVLVSSGFEMTFSADEDTLKVEPGILEVGHYLAWGHTRPLKEFLEKRHGYFDELGDVSAIENLIQLAIADRPDMVGEPIAIIRVNRTGAEWVKPSACCPPIEPY